jgi:hypothetical protein
MEPAAMNEAAIKKQLSDLIDSITSSPFAGQGAPPSQQGVYHSETATRDLAVDGSLDHLRLQIKYLLFDLEATRRENRYLRQMLESRHKRDVDDFKGEAPEQ